MANSRNLIGTIQNVIQLRIRLPWHTVYCQLLFWTDYLREVKTNSRRAYYRTAQAVNTGRPQFVIRIAKVREFLLKVKESSISCTIYVEKMFGYQRRRGFEPPRS